MTAARQLGRRARFGLSAMLLSLLLAACGNLPDKPADAGAAANAEAAKEPPLRPLARQPGTPADEPRSRVPMVRYDLAVGRYDDETAPDDGVPGDEPPGEVFQRGGASYYGLQFHQRRTANGERFDMGAMTAAHRTLPFNTRVCVRSLVNGREVLVRINDRGPFVPGRIIDLSQAAAESIGLISLGIKQVTLTIVGPDGGRCSGQDVAARGERDADEPSAASASDVRTAAAPVKRGGKAPRRKVRGNRR